MNNDKPSANDIATGDPQMRKDDITAQDAAHDSGDSCDEEDCQDCCGEFIGHEFDPDEGGYCMNDHCEANGYECGE